MAADWVYGSAWRRMRQVVLVRDGRVCQVRLQGCTMAADCVDHIIPVSENGARLDPSNLRASCTHCNLARNSGRLAKLGVELAAALSGPPPSEIGPSRRW